jgi:histidine kinase
MEGLIDGVIPANDATYQQVHSEADRLQRLVNDLQELSRVESGAYTLNLQPVSISDLIRKMINHLNLQFEEKGILLETDLPADIPKVTADEDRILQVLTNLAGNALQYTPQGGKVRISASKGKGEVEITITDTGIGIAPEHIPYLFNRFYRVDKSRARVSGGSGIGLTVAQNLVKAHGGRIWGESEGKGKGSSFHFTLPVQATQ